ncbi:MAG TPA: hypothetical protein VHM01_11025 [Alphaproteobacteria bacterium]|nr:hypothetical protein [Alphaproteobacteria bacterium]
MIEIIIERWSGPDGTTFRWSLWRDGRRVGMGPDYPTAEEAEAIAASFCAKTLGTMPDRVTRL